MEKYDALLAARAVGRVIFHMLILITSVDLEQIDLDDRFLGLVCIDWVDNDSKSKYLLCFSAKCIVIQVFGAAETAIGNADLP